MRLLYDRRRIDDAAAGRLLGHLRTLLEALPAHAADPVRDLPMLTPAERRQVLYDWNATAGDYPARPRPGATRRGAGGPHAGRGRRRPRRPGVDLP